MDKHSVLRPETPKNCPKQISYQKKCLIKNKGWRHRRHGPGFPLIIFECCIHSGSFTIYPPGWEPYGREATVDVAPDGSVYIDEADDAPSLANTVFAAAIDAADEIKWPEEAHSDRYLKGVFKTQKRHINGLLRLLGIARESSEKCREHVTARLGIALSDLQHAHARIRDGPRLLWREKGLQLKGLITTLQPLSRHLASIQILGSEVEFWGQPINCQ